jgi:flavorubredoxin
MAKALIVYATRTGNTKLMAEAIAEGLQETGINVKIMDVNDVTSDSDLTGNDAYLFGSSTLHHEMTQEMQKLLVIAKKAPLEGKIGGAFGAYGWSGEAPKKIHETMEFTLGMEMADNVLRIKTPVALENLRQDSKTFGREIGQKIQ